MLQALLLAVTSLWPHKVDSRVKIYSSMEIHADFLKAGAVCLLFNRWFTSGILNKSTVGVETSSM